MFILSYETTDNIVCKIVIFVRDMDVCCKESRSDLNNSKTSSAVAEIDYRLATDIGRKSEGAVVPPSVR